MKENDDIVRVLENDEYTTKIRIFMATETVDESYDRYENNKVRTNLNPITIKGYVRDISPEKLYWKQYGKVEGGGKEVICKAKYADLFRNANKIVIDGDEYSCYKEGVGGNAGIVKRPFQTIRVTLVKVDRHV
ncbi:MAG: hypothetical protein BWY21_01754 [Parcubacteria group bacterium ADurb.Bin216]|nr:MAG: hypothetical protein BWY21_01754 [Parcubacteria group bacterium ADurb.Bin216]